MRNIFVHGLIIFFSLSTLMTLYARQYDFVQLSEELLVKIKNGEEYCNTIACIENLSLDDLEKALDTDQKKKAFWINIYNAYIQIILTEKPFLFENRNKFFSDKHINLGNQLLSFDFIEHGIIRGSKVKLALGYMNDPFASNFEKRFRVEQTDGRVHFALNCGAKSCPEIQIYSAAKVEKELDTATNRFLQQNTSYDLQENAVYVSPLFLWFRADFNDKGGALGYLRMYKVIPKDISSPHIKYYNYDWTLSLHNFLPIQD